MKILVGIMVPGLFIAIGLVQQDQLGRAIQLDGWVAVLALIAGALASTLPRRFPYPAAFLAILVFAWISTSTAFAGLTLILLVLAGFFIGLSLRSLLYQRMKGKNVRSRRDSGPGR